MTITETRAETSARILRRAWAIARAAARKFSFGTSTNGAKAFIAGAMQMAWEEHRAGLRAVAEIRASLKARPVATRGANRMAAIAGMSPGFINAGARIRNDGHLAWYGR